MKKVLVFPSGVGNPSKITSHLRALGIGVVGASSLEIDSSSNYFDRWERLPFISESNFTKLLRDMIERLDIDGIYSFHAPTYLFLSELLPKEFPSIKLLCDSPYARQMQWVEQSLANATPLRVVAESWTVQRGDSWLAALLAEAETIYGECSADKIRALYRIFSTAPRGDVIEVGSFFGKSACVLNRLAYRFAVGATIAIDPWDMGASVQKDSSEVIQDLSTEWDWDLVFAGFLLAMESRAVHPFNFIRATSEDGHAVYRGRRSVSTPQFGETNLAGRIAVLHIDGNHDRVSVSQDLDMWSDHLAPGGWLVVDDYEWSLGDGPRVATDEFVRIRGERISESFVAGGAFFLKVE